MIQIKIGNEFYDAVPSLRVALAALKKETR